MNTVAILCFTFLVASVQALPPPGHLLSEEVTQKLEKLGLGLGDTFDYNQFILNLEDVIEEFQHVALKAIDDTVDLAQQFVRSAASLAAQENIEQISTLQSSYFKMFEAMRHLAFEQTIDISPCVFPSVQRIHNESQASINEITTKLQNITNVFNDYTAVTYTNPSKENLMKSYSIRERIYQCPFSFTDFMPFYLCLTLTAVLEDIVTLNEFAVSFNDTATNVLNLVVECEDAVTFFQKENVDAFSVAADAAYNDGFVPCAAEHGYKIHPVKS